MKPCAVRLIAFPLLPALFACGVSTQSGASPPSHDAAIETVRAHKCGKCHVPPEPKSRTRDHVESALARHQDRVRLTPAQWCALIDYLSAPLGPTARQGP